MSAVLCDLSMSLDGYITGPDPGGRDQPLGEGGERLHEWAFKLAAWREPHGRSGGERGPDNDLVEELLGRTGAFVMGRKMFGGGGGPWGDEPWEGWWGDEPPFHAPVFVLTHHPREPLRKGETTFTFVTDGVESAVEQARAAAGGRDVQVSGGAEVAQQCLTAGLLDELQLHVVPVLLGGGVRLLDHVDPGRVELEKTMVVDSPDATHLRYAVRSPEGDA